MAASKRDSAGRRSRLAIGCLAMIALAAGGFRLVKMGRDVAQQRTEAQSARQIAERADACFERGVSAIRRGELREALPWIAEAFKDGQRRRHHQLLFDSTLRQLPTLVQQWEHPQPIDFFKFNHDGSYLLTSAGRTANVWDIRKGTQYGKALSHRGSVRCASFSKDSAYVAIGTGGDRVGDSAGLCIWDLAQGSSRCETTDSPVIAVAFTRNDLSLATIDRDGTISRWRWLTLEPLEETLEHGSDLDTALLQNGLAVTCANDGTIRVWDTESFEPQHAFSHAGCTCVALSHDGMRLVTGGHEGDARVWRLDGDASSVRPMVLRHGARLLDVAIDLEQQVFTLGADNTVWAWDLEEETPLARDIPSATEVNSMQLSPDGRQLLIIAADQSVAGFSTSTTASTFAPLRQNSGVDWAGISPSGHELLTLAGGLLRVHDLAQSPAWRSEAHYRQPVLQSQFLDRLVSLCKDGTAYETDLRNDDRNRLLLPAGDLVALTTSADYETPYPSLVTGSQRGMLRVWYGSRLDLKTSALLSDAIRRVRYNRPARKIGIAVGNTVSVRTAANVADEVASLPHASTVTDLGFISSEDVMIVTACEDGTITFWDGASYERIGAVSHPPGDLSLAVPWQGTHFASVSGDGARIWEAMTQQPRSEVLHHQGATTLAAFSNAGTHLVTAAEDGTVRVWDSASGEPLTPWLQHDSPVTCAAFDWDQNSLATAGRDGTVYIWNPNGGQLASPPLTYPEAVTHLTFDRTGRTLAVSYADGAVRAWDVTASDRDTEHCVRLAELWCEARVEGDRLVPLTREELTQRWTEVAADRATQAATARQFPESPELAFERKVFPFQTVTPEPLIRWHLREAETSFDDKAWSASLWHLNRAVSIDPGLWSLLRRRGDVHRERGDLEAAITDYTRAIVQSEHDVLSLLGRGMCYAEQQDWTSAADDFLDAIGFDRHSSYLRALHALARLRAGDQARYRAANLESLAFVIETKPDPPPTFFDPPCWTPRDDPEAVDVVLRASLLSPGGDVSVTEKWAAELHRFLPDEPAFLNTWALAMYRAGDFERARDVMQTFFSRHAGAETATDWLLMAMLSFQLESAEEGRAALDKAQTSHAPASHNWFQNAQFEMLLEEARQLQRKATAE